MTPPNKTAAPAKARMNPMPKPQGGTPSASHEPAVPQRGLADGPSSVLHATVESHDSHENGPLWSAFHAPVLFDPLLGVMAEAVSDLEKQRVATANRMRRLVTPSDAEDKDGIGRGLGLDSSHPSVAAMAATLSGIEAIEKQAISMLEKQVRTSPLYPAIKSWKGVGDKQVARLLAKIGDPYWHGAENRPRTLAELWSYCGYGVIDGVAPKRTRGVQSNWSEEARMRAWNIAGSCVKAIANEENGWAAGKHRLVYEAAKAKYAEAVHTKECVRCGPSGKPAQVGSPLSDGHKHARAMRIVAKEVLRDLWLASREFHQQPV